MFSRWDSCRARDRFIVTRCSTEDVVSSPRRSIALMRLIGNILSAFEDVTMAMTTNSGSMILTPMQPGKSMRPPRVPRCSRTVPVRASCRFGTAISAPAPGLAASRQSPLGETENQAGALFVPPSVKQDRSGRIVQSSLRAGDHAMKLRIFDV